MTRKPKPRHFEDVAFVPGQGYVPDPEPVTAPVTRPAAGPWDAAGMTEEAWKTAYEIPPFLRRVAGPSTPTSDATVTSSGSHVSSGSRVKTTTAKTPSAAATAGKTSGSPSKPATETSEPPPQEDPYAKFQVDFEDIERKIRIEADRRRREWMPSKGQTKQPRKSWFEKQVRKEYYP